MFARSAPAGPGGIDQPGLLLKGRGGVREAVRVPPTAAVLQAPSVPRKAPPAYQPPPSTSSPPTDLGHPNALETRQPALFFPLFSDWLLLGVQLDFGGHHCRIVVSSGAPAVAKPPPPPYKPPSGFNSHTISLFPPIFAQLINKYFIWVIRVSTTDRPSAVCFFCS